jgi:hypothetical protein
MVKTSTRVVTTIKINNIPTFKDQSSNTTEHKTVWDTFNPNNKIKCTIIISIKYKIKISNIITINNTKTREATMVDITKIKIKTIHIKVEEAILKNNSTITQFINKHKPK